MQLLDSIKLSNYLRILKENKKTPLEIERLKREYILLIEGAEIENMSAELKAYLNYLKEQENGKTR